jgi:hypothetical protein
LEESGGLKIFLRFCQALLDWHWTGFEKGRWTEWFDIRLGSFGSKRRLSLGMGGVSFSGRARRIQAETGSSSIRRRRRLRR